MANRAVLPPGDPTPAETSDRLYLGRCARLAELGDGRTGNNPRVGAVLVYGTLDMPMFGAADAPVQTHVAGAYLVRTSADIDIPNVVSAVLASYRGFDTLGEVIVVFTAGLGVVMLISRIGRRRRGGGER